MTRLDDRLKHDLERAGRLPDPSGVYDDLVRRKERRRIVRKTQGVLLSVIVVAATAAGFYGLTRVFPLSDGGAASGPENGLIVYSDNRVKGWDEDGVRLEDDWHLYVIDPQTREVTRIGPDEIEEALYPTWSPDATRVAFVGFTDTRPSPPREAVYVMNADGTDVTEIFAVPEGQQVEGLRWSPDGTRIGYQLAAPDIASAPFGSPPSYTIWTMAVDGTDHRQVTTIGREMHFSWSPDGTRIVFERFEPLDDPHDLGYAGTDLFIVDVDGGNEVRLTHDGISRDPSWSPDGPQIAFSRGAFSGESGTDRHVAILGIDGTLLQDLEQASTNEAGAAFPYGNMIAWSPDGRLIAFADRSADEDVCAIRAVEVADGSVRTIVSSPGADACPGQEGMSWGIALSGVEDPWATETPAQTPSATETPVVTNVAEPTRERDVPMRLPRVGAVCGVTAIEGRFLGEELTRAYVFESEPEGGCDGPNEEFQFVGVADASGELVVVSDELQECLPVEGCWAFAAPDVDGDGRDEIAVATGHEYDAVRFSLYRVEECGSAADCVAERWLQRFEIVDPGDPHEGFPAGPVRFRWGGPPEDVAGVTCGRLGGRPALVNWYSATDDQWLLVHGPELALANGAELDLTTLGLDELCGATVSVERPASLTSP